MKRLIISFVLLALAQSGFAQDKIEERAKMKDGATLQVVNVSGSISISGWRKNEIEVIAELGDEAERLVFEPDGDGFLVEVVQKERGDRDDRDSYRSSGSRLNIKVPFSTHLKVKAVSADVKVSDVRGKQRIRTVSGDIMTQVDGEEAELRSVSGDITASGNGKVGEFMLYSVSGDVTAEALAGEVSSESVSGDLHINGTNITEVNLKTVSGDIEAKLALKKDARLQMESVSGDVEARLPGNYAAEYELTSFSGDISEVLGNTATRKSKHSPGSELIFVHGSSKARVRVNTLSGDIELKPNM